MSTWVIVGAVIVVAVVVLYGLCAVVYLLASGHPRRRVPPSKTDDGPE